MNALLAPRNWLRLAWGTTLLAVPPEVVARALSGDADTQLPTAVVRVLGVRHVAQAVLAMLLDDSRISQLSRVSGAVLDAAHVASLPLLARAVQPAHRRLVAIDAPVEALLATLQLGSARH